VPSTAGATAGTFTAATTGETSADVWYRLHLDVADSSGLTAGAFVDVLPRTARLTLATEPPGLQVTLDGTPLAAPHDELGVVGVQRSLGAPSPQVVGGTRYELVSWSDGGAPTHTVATPATDTTYLATFRAAAETHGLLATWFEGELARPLLVRLEPRVDFDWRSGRPAPGVPADGFGLRLSGELEAPASGTFTFHLRSDEGARLWVDGRKVVDDWGPHGERTRRGTIALVAGRRYPIVLEYRELQGPAMLRLLWSAPGVPREVVPSARLFAAAPPR
jgi:hypothetical protein